MKQIFSLLSAFIFLFGAAGYYLAFTAADRNVKNEMSEDLESPTPHFSLIHLAFSGKDLNDNVHFTGRNQKEFIYRGEHYDVVESHWYGGNVFFTCAKDVKETSLFSFFTKHFDEQSSKNNSSQKTSLKTAMADWFFQNHISEYADAASAITFPKEASVLSKLSFPIPSPPPKA